MKSNLKYSLVFILCIIYVKASDKLKISIFYDSHCDCSSTLIRKNFYPAYKNIQTYVTIDLVPYGRTKQFVREGKSMFECANLDHTCQANKIHACAVKSNSPEDKIVEFVYCIIDTVYTKEDVTRCCFVSGLDQRGIDECINKKANKLLSNFGNRTRSYNFARIPAVVFDDKYDEKVDEKARENFMAAVCDYLNYQDSLMCDLYDGL